MRIKPKASTSRTAEATNLGATPYQTEPARKIRASNSAAEDTDLEKQMLEAWNRNPALRGKARSTASAIIRLHYPKLANRDAERLRDGLRKRVARIQKKHRQ